MSLRHARGHGSRGQRGQLQREAGEVLCILGESGSGKTVTLRTLLRLLPPRRTRIEGQVLVDGQDVLAMPAKELRDLRGGLAAMIFQEPMTALDPVYTIGQQIGETVRRHTGCDRRAARARALELLDLVRVPVGRAAARRLPARTVGRPAPARDDRDGAVVRSAAAAGRRADDRARRDGADPGADPVAPAAARARHGDDLRHPRSRRRLARSPTGSRSCMPAASSRRGRSRRC